MSLYDHGSFERSMSRAQRQYDNQMPPEDPRDGMDEPENFDLEEDFRKDIEAAAGDAKFDLDR